MFVSHSLHVSIVGFFPLRQKRIRGGSMFAECNSAPLRHRLLVRMHHCLNATTWPQPPLHEICVYIKTRTKTLTKEHQLNKGLPCSRTVGFGSHLIQFEGAWVWNHLPNKIRCAENLASLNKKQLLGTWGGYHCDICNSYF